MKNLVNGNIVFILNKILQHEIQFLLLNQQDSQEEDAEQDAEQTKENTKHVSVGKPTNP